MKNRITFYFGILVAIVFVLYMVTFQVGFNEAVVITTLGAADDESAVIRGHDPDSTRGAGLFGFGNLHLKWPAPIQKVYAYDQRVQILEDRIEQQQTLDSQTVNANTYIAWRIDDPLAFYRSLVTNERAQQQLTSLLRDARSAIGDYTLGELTNADPAKLKLEQLEADILEAINHRLAGFEAEGSSWGVKVDAVGIKRLILPEDVTVKVFARMRATRDAMAQEARSQGEAEADRIKAQADAQARIILAFAEQRADQIRAEGDAAAAQWAQTFAKNEGFAIFLRRLDTIREVFRGPTTTFFFGPDQFPEFATSPTPESINQLGQPVFPSTTTPTTGDAR